MLTDFGTRDHYVGVMKAVITGINPNVILIDLSHDVPPQDRLAALHFLRSSYRFFPQGCVHMIVVDPGVGGRRRKIAVAATGQFFVGPDNGILGSLLDGKNISQAVSLEDERFFLHPVSRTFHGRDVFAPVAAHISLGVPLNEFGPPIDSLEKLPIATPVVHPGRLSGEIIHIDRFGNLVTNISAELWEQTIGERAFNLRVGRIIVSGLSDSYDSVVAGAPLAILGSSGLLEISVSMGNAAEVAGAKAGDAVEVMVGA